MSTRPDLLPAVLVLTDRRAAAAGGHALPGLVASLAGIDAGVVFREKDLLPIERVAVGHEVADAARRAGILFLVASSPEIALRLGADGVHLAASDPPASFGLVGRSCHDLRELVAASTGGVSYVTLSPVYPTPTKPDHGPPLGLDGLARLARASALPVYALAGVGPGRAGECVEAGAYGVAMLGSVMRAGDPAELVAAVAAEVHDTRSPSPGE